MWPELILLSQMREHCLNLQVNWGEARNLLMSSDGCSGFCVRCWKADISVLKNANRMILSILAAVLSCQKGPRNSYHSQCVISLELHFMAHFLSFWTSGLEDAQQDAEADPEVCGGWSGSECHHLKDHQWGWEERWRNAIPQASWRMAIGQVGGLV